MIQAPIRRSLSEPTIGGDKGMMHSSACATRVLFSRYRHAGKERDTESGNDYFFARYYSSALGRFMSPDWSAKVDPVPYAAFTDPQSLNLYAYVGNNPLSHVDLDGHVEPCGFWCEPLGAGQTEREKELNMTEAEQKKQAQKQK